MNREDGTRLWLPFRYERLSDFCYTCGKIDHTESTCNHTTRDKDPDEDPITQYGTWMRGQYLESIKGPEYRPPLTQKPPGVDDRGNDEDCTKLIFTKVSSSDAPTPDLHQNGNLLQQLPNSDATFAHPPNLHSSPATMHAVNSVPFFSTTQTPANFQMVVSAALINKLRAPQPNLDWTPPLGPKALSLQLEARSRNETLRIEDVGLDLITSDPPKRKATGPLLHLSKFTRNDYLESIHAAMERMNIMQPPKIQGQLTNVFELGEEEIQEEHVTISCRCLIHVKR